MRIAILTVGSQGDVRPQVAIAAGLVHAGHRVTVVTLPAFRDLALSCGAEFTAVNIDPYEFIRGDIGQSWMSSMDSPVRLLRGVSAAAGQFIGRLNDDALAGCAGCDALLYNVPLSFSGATIAEALGVPGIPTAVAPYHPTRDFPSIFMTAMPVQGRAVNRASGTAAIWALWRMIRTHINRWRRSQPGLGPLPVRQPLGAMGKAGVPWLYGFSPSVVPAPGDWPDSAVVCGYWFTPADASWQAPADLLRFIAAGPAPLYVGFGSMVGADPSRTAGIVLESLARTGKRAVIATGWGGMEKGTVADNVFTVDHVPHEWLFPRMAAVVHHGGAGTTAATLRAGVPSVVVPYFYDQFFWAERLHRLGVAPRPIPHTKLSVDALVDALRSVLDNPSAARKAADLSVSIGRENGVQTAVDVIDRYLRKTTLRRIR